MQSKLLLTISYDIISFDSMIFTIKASHSIEITYYSIVILYDIIEM